MLFNIFTTLMLTTGVTAIVGIITSGHDKMQKILWRALMIQVLVFFVIGLALLWIHA